jgi:hypothetical protein
MLLQVFKVAKDTCCGFWAWDEVYEKRALDEISNYLIRKLLSKEVYVARSSKKKLKKCDRRKCI